MAEIKVLALDLDGTLTNSQKEVTPRTRAALDAAIAKGVTIVLASGRPTAGVLPLAKELGLDKKGGCILSYNGGKIIDCRGGGPAPQGLYRWQRHRLPHRRDFVPETAGCPVRTRAVRLCRRTERDHYHL